MSDPSASAGSARERMLAGEPYLADDPELAAMHLRCMDLQEEYNRSSARDGEGRTRLLQEMLGAVGEDVVIRPPLHLDYGVHLSIGAGTFVNYNLVALDCHRITIGRDCQIAPNVQLLTAWHVLEPEARRAKWEGASPITLGDNVWLGGGVIVLPGVTIGDNTVVGSGAVVTKDLPANVVAVGNPARVIRRLDETGADNPQD